MAFNRGFVRRQGTEIIWPNRQQLATKILLRGTLAEQPQAGPSLKGCYYFNTSQPVFGQLYQCILSGNVWIWDAVADAIPM